MRQPDSGDNDALALDPRNGVYTWQAVGAALLVSTGIYFLLPQGSVAQAAVFVSLPVVATALLIRRTVRQRHDMSGLWWVLVAGLSLYTVVTAIWYLLPVVAGVQLGFPTAIDWLFLLAHLLYGIFLLGVIGRRHRTGDVDERRPALIDATIVAVAVAVVVWEITGAYIADSTQASATERMAAVAFPAAAALVLALTARLSLYGQRQFVPDLLLLVWAGGELAATIFYGPASALGTFAFGDSMFLGWLVSYSALGAFAVHPALWQVTTPEPAEAPTRRRRYWPVVLAALVPLLVIVPKSDHPGYVAAAVITLGLVVVRIGILSGDLDEQRRLATELVTLSDEMRHRALHDSLTGLGNRAMLMERLTHALERRPPRPGATTALLVLDLDGFKGVNDTLGHATGDHMLIEVADRLTSAVRPDDTVVRLGGDEFAIILGDVDTEQALRATKRILTRLEQPVQIDARSLPVRASIGVRMTDPNCTAGTAMRDADLAMYVAKDAGGDRYQLFDSAVHADFIERHEMELALADAPDRNELRLQYQPIMDLNSGLVQGAEALVRWQHPTKGYLYPDAFIELAEMSGAIVAIGNWVLEEACRQLRRWQHDGDLPPGFQMAVNVSRRDLLDPRVVPRMVEVVQRTGCAPVEVIIEVTETALMADTEQLVVRLAELRQHGFPIAMDDFGTGYSSLDQLRHLPIDILKIDRAFVAGITQGREDFMLATAIVKLATSLGYRSLAEGVETAGQLAHLRALGVEHAQGYLFARPGAAADIQRMWKAPVADRDGH